jgi:Xaa-Pro dipeptidase
VLWYGRTPTREQCWASSDVDDVRYISALNRTLCASLSSETILYVLRANQAPELPCRRFVHLDSEHLLPAIERARVIKTDYEIAMIRRANAVSVSKLICHHVLLFRTF